MSRKPTSHGHEPGPEGHFDAPRIQAYLDGDLPARERSIIEAHADTCARCEDELDAWRVLFAELGSLPHLEPSPGFADAVLERALRPEPAGAVAETARWAGRGLREAWERAAAWGRRLVPRTPRGWATATAVALTPMAALGALSYWIFSRPGITPVALVAYAGSRLRDGAADLLGRAGGLLLESPIAYQAYSLGGALFRSPESALLAGFAFTTLVAGASWILYRNLFATSTVDMDHAHYSF